MFDRIDANRDGSIDETEWSAASQRLPRGGPPAFGERFLSFFDSNADGKVSRDEFARLTGLFSSLDADHNSLLNRAELGQLLGLWTKAASNKARACDPLIPERKEVKQHLVHLSKL